MAEHPDVQARMQAEVDSVLGDALTPPDHEIIETLPYVEAVAHETMRVLPVAPLQAYRGDHRHGHR